MAETETVSSTVTVSNRKVLTGSDGSVWDLANTNIIGVRSQGSDSTSCLLVTTAGQEPVLIPFSVAISAFNGS